MDCSGSTGWKYTCYKLQPQWLNPNSVDYAGYTDGYPRFGVDETEGAKFYAYKGPDTADLTGALEAIYNSDALVQLSGSVVSQVTLTMSAVGSMLLSYYL